MVTTPPTPSLKNQRTVLHDFKAGGTTRLYHNTHSSASALNPLTAPDQQRGDALLQHSQQTADSSPPLPQDHSSRAPLPSSGLPKIKVTKFWIKTIRNYILPVCFKKRHARVSFTSNSDKLTVLTARAQIQTVSAHQPSPRLGKPIFCAGNAITLLSK